MKCCNNNCDQGRQCPNRRGDFLMMVLEVLCVGLLASAFVILWTMV